MTSRIGGALDLRAMADLAGGDARMRAFRLLTRDAQAEAIRRLIAEGMSEHGAAAATGLSVEFIRRMLAPKDGATR